MPQKLFTTPRLTRWRATNPGDDFAATLTNIETYGCHILQIKGTATTPGYSYSVGIYDTCHQPEIIAVGLPQAAAVTAINKAAALLRSGATLTGTLQTTSRQPDILAKHPCHFLPVDTQWIDHIMGRAMWFYDEAPPPTLQLIYPDLNGRFQPEPGFDDRFRQPLLQTGAPRTAKEEAFWAASE